MGFFRLSALAARLGPGRPQTLSIVPAPIPDFDWITYTATYRDLPDLPTEAAAMEHFQRHGLPQGRLGTAAAVQARIAALQARHGPLPDDFDWRAYVETYPDLADIVASYAAAAHYLQFGQAEGRLYRAFDVNLYRSLTFGDAAIADAAVIAHYRAVGRPAGAIASLADLARSEDLADGDWLAALDVAAFDLLHRHWAGPIANVRQALRAMMGRGFERIAAISFAHEFDPAYYAEANPALAAVPASARYRQWLAEGLSGERPGTAADHLHRHGLRLAVFPAGFDWASYKRRRGVFGDSRWALLDHLVANDGIAARDIPLHAAGGGAFLAALAGTLGERGAARGIDLYAEADRIGVLGPAEQAHWGDLLLRQANWAAALERYTPLLDRPDVQVTTVVHAATAAARLGLFERAFACLGAGKAATGGDIRWRTALRETIEARFAAAWAEAEQLYAVDRRAEADDRLTAVVAEIAMRWSTLDPLGVPMPPARPRRFVLLANVDLPQCTRYRVDQKAEIFAAAGLDLAVFTQAEVEDFLTALPGATAALFYRLPATPMTIRAITVCRAMGIPSFYDIDDLIFDAAHYPEPIGTYGAGVDKAFYRSLQLGVPLFRAAMALCDLGIASTLPLATHMDKVVRRGTTAVLPNGLDSRNLPLFDHPPRRVRRSGDIMLFYGSGTTAHNADFLDLVGDALVTLMARHPNLRLTVAGSLSLDARFDPLRDRIVQIGWIKDLHDYWSLLTEADIAMAVLVPGPTTDAKSEIKWLEAAALGVPSIVSATAHLANVLEDGVDAVLARSPADWLAGLDALIVRPERRAALAAAARTKALRLYGLDRNAERLRRLLGPVLDGAVAREPVRPGKKRLLLVNIFFPPQSIGGSTRVTRDNLDSFLDGDFAAECDFAVVTTDNDNPVPYRLRVEEYRGVPVFRMSTPIAPNMEWRPFDPAAGVLFGQVLDAWRPDLVHVHSIQRATASILAACLRRGIPYMNTIHDAWWVSDYQFLVDGRGRVRSPEEPLPLDPPPPVSVGEALERRRRLRVLLELSEEILCVSDSFTRLHHAAGFPTVRAVPNGVPAMTAVVRTPSPDGRVRLAQIGSRTHHKGYALIEAALKQSRFGHLDLTIVDHGRFGGLVDHTTWGTTPVRFIGKTPQERMHEFYARIDVLLAPSIWPESFGLVAREATAAGVWVLASDRGAIGEGIVPGVNGWIVDVSSTAGLVAALAEIDADPDRYRVSPPPPSRPVRTADDQARDMVAIYRSIFARTIEPRPLPAFLRDDEQA